MLSGIVSAQEEVGWHQKLVMATVNGCIHTMVASCLPIAMLLKKGQKSGVNIAQNKT